MEVAPTFFQGVVKMSSRGRPQDNLWATPSRRIPEYVLKTSLRRLKTSRLFLVGPKDPLETKYGLSIYIRFILRVYYHSITRHTNWIYLNKLNTLKH